MKKRGLLLLLVILIFSSTVVFAASINGTFAGLPIVNVKINDEIIKPSVPGIVLQGSTMLPARAIAENLNAVVGWDQATMTATITKPDATICFVDDVVENKYGGWDLINPYGILGVGQGQDVIVYYEIGPMEKQVYEFRFIIKEPNGDILKSTSADRYEISSTGMFGAILIDDIAFKQVGNYKFELQIKYGDEFKSIEDKILVIE